MQTQDLTGDTDPSNNSHYHNAIYPVGIRKFSEQSRRLESVVLVVVYFVSVALG